MLKVLDLFSGIGGFSLGLERTGGFETVAFCENEKSGYPQKVLAKHWPEVPIYEDVRDVTAKQLRSDGIIPNVITGGFPCQDISVAGNQKGMGEGTRSGLWSECARLVGEIRPRYAIFENVTALLSGADGKWFQQVLWDLSEVGYDAEWHCIPASELGAHHHRDRVWIICYPQKLQRDGNNTNGEDGKCKIPEPGNTSSEKDVEDSNSKRQQKLNIPRKSEKQEQPDRGCNATSDTNSQRLQRREKYGIFGEGGSRWHELTTGRFCGFQDISEIEPTVCRGVNGIPNYAHRLKGLGNAICPPISELIGRAILEAENEAM
jgi:DNA (cytosine-5)-methyltransferase 1